MIRAVLFDLDGTLIDSLADISSALCAALADHSLAQPTIDTVRTWIGGGARNLIVHAIDAARLAPDMVDVVLARFRVHYAAAPIVKTRLYPGLAPVLDELVVADLRLAVLTNKPHDLAVRICGPLLAPWPFGMIVGQRAGVALKPDPGAALQIAAELGVPPEDCAFVGDSAVDLDTARAAGMRAVGVSWGFRPRDELEACNPWLLVDDPAGLRALLT
ncbi:MAG: HAD-IA family hydrolase [Deltaproteobacteria bacterium]|nr:HAD-IA family hydrolase [Deltaproteobacteria bacterium]